MQPDRQGGPFLHARKSEEVHDRGTENTEVKRGVKGGRSRPRLCVAAAIPCQPFSIIIAQEPPRRYASIAGSHLGKVVEP